jgi:hypothetical protein
VGLIRGYFTSIMIQAEAIVTGHFAQFLLSNNQM